MWKNQVNTQELSDGIRNYFSRFSWVSAELKGTRLSIYVKEGLPDEEEPDESENGTLSGIAAAKSGEIISIYVRKGIAAVAAGDVVEAGTLLVSGQIPIYSDDGEIISWQETTADADIVIRTETPYYEELEYETELKYYTGKEKVRHMLRVGGAFFSLPGNLTPYDSGDVTGEITQMKISENFYLPIWFYKYTIREYENLNYIISKEQACENLEDNLYSFIESLKKKGVQIFQNNVTIGTYEKSAVAQGILITDESAVTRVDESAPDI